MLLCYEFGSEFFGFLEESLKGEFFFFSFFGSFVPRDSIFFSSIEFYRFIPSSTRFNVRLVSGIGIDVVRAESVMNRPSRTAIDRFFEPWLRPFKEIFKASILCQGNLRTHAIICNIKHPFSKHFEINI